MDIGGLSTEAIAAAAQYLAEKAAGGAATAAGSKLFDWLKTKLAGRSEQELLDKLSATPSSQGVTRSLDGALLSHLEQHLDEISEIRQLLADVSVLRSTQTVVGSENTAIQAGDHNTINIHRTGYGALRSCIECALYALIMRHRPSTQEVWINRQSNRLACRNTFAFGAGLAILEKMDAPLAQLIHELYDAAIDNGAHPNILSLGRHLDFSDWDEENNIRNILLLPEDDQAVEGVLHSGLLVGAAVASIYPHVMPEHGPAIAAPQDAKLTLKSVIASVAG